MAGSVVSAVPSQKSGCVLKAAFFRDHLLIRSTTGSVPPNVPLFLLHQLFLQVFKS
jgi:hypothetical protein